MAVGAANGRHTVLAPMWGRPEIPGLIPVARTSRWGHRLVQILVDGVAGMRILSLNLWGRRGEWERRRQVLRTGLGALDPDLVAFQESIKTDRYDQVRDLLGPNYYLAHQEIREPGGPADVEAGQGISIASRWPIEDVHELDLHVTPRTADFACGVLLAQIQAPPPIGPLLFVNHFPNWQLAFEYERELQAVAAARAIEERADASG